LTTWLRQPEFPSERCLVCSTGLLWSTATRLQIEEVIARLKFSPSSRTRGLALRRSFLIGLIHNDHNALVLDSLQKAVLSTVVSSGYELVTHPTAKDSQEALDELLAFVERSRVDGLIVLPPVSGIRGLAQALADAGIHAVALSSVPIKGFSHVILIKEREAGADVARYLVELGHRKLGIINGPRHVMSANERRAGFVGEAYAAGASVIEAEGDYRFASGVAGAEQLLALQDRPTAIFAANDIMAAGVLKVAASRGVAVPQDVSVAGFDGSRITQMFTPALASVHRPFAEMAQAAAMRLIALIEGKAPPLLTEFTMLIILAETAGPPKGFRKEE
jgi:LacI family transcriptional regulator